MTAWHSFAAPMGSGTGEHTLNTTGTWLLAHYLSADCPCSQAVARHLEERGPLGSRAAERVFVIGEEQNPAGRQLIARLAQAGFSATAIMPEAAATNFGVEGVPLLKVVAPDGSVRFRGGYREPADPPGRYLDVAIFTGLAASQSVPHPRVLGCATSRRMKQFLDPLSLKALNAL